MSAALLVVSFTTFVFALALTWWVRRLALARGMLDHPNARSSHTIPTPRGGGVAIVVSSVICVVALAALGVVDVRLALALAGGGVPVAWIGFVDDRRSVSARVRIVVHAGAAVWAVYVLGGLPPLQWGASVFDLGIAGDIATVIAIVWALNLFNFMDGIDGIAGSEAVFVAGAGAFLGAHPGALPATAAAALAVMMASLGFLIWNWPPARIFMGDVGSGYLGFALAVLALSAARENPVALYVWLILGGLFFVDATVTFLRRLLRGEPVHVAHRTHAYQRLARYWSGHRRVTLLALLVNVFWLFPCAWLACAHPVSAHWIVVGALAPVVVAVMAAGAGRRELGP